MNYQKNMSNLIKEARQNIRFKDLKTWVKVLLIIGLVPLIISTFFSIVSYYVLLFFYKGFLAPVEYLHILIKNEGKEVKHATQFIIYWIAFPFIFTLYVLQSITAVLFYFSWFGVMINLYLVTLGGIKFQPFIMEASFEKTNWELTPGEKGIKIFTIILFSLFILSILELILINSTILLIIYIIVLVIVNPILFKKTPKNEELEA